MKIKDIVKQSDKEIEKSINDLRSKIATYKRDRYMKDDRNVRTAAALRKDLARMLGEHNLRKSKITNSEEGEK